MDIYSTANRFIKLPLYVGCGPKEPQYILTASQSIVQLLIPRMTYRAGIVFASGDVVDLSQRVRWLAKNYYSIFKDGVIRRNGDVVGSIRMTKNDDSDSWIPWQFAIENGSMRLKLTVEACREHTGSCVVSQDGRPTLTLFRRHCAIQSGFRHIGTIDESAINTNDAWLYYSLIPFYYFIVDRFVAGGEQVMDFLNERI